MRILRLAILGLLLTGCAATTAELLLLEHYEDGVQIVPLALAGGGAVVALWNLAAPGWRSVRVLQVLMLFFVAAGFAGVLYHYDANVEFQRELDPSLAGRALLWKVLQAKAPPALSPGLMVQLGLLGLAFSFRHPALDRGSEGDS